MTIYHTKDNMEELSAEVATEVIQVLYNSDSSIICKIPYRIIEVLQEKSEESEKKVNFKENTELKDQDISEESKAILSILYRDYICSEEEKIEVNKVFENNQKQYEEFQREKYNPDKIFEQDNKIKVNNTVVENSLIEIPKDKWYVVLFNKIKSIFKKDI